VIGLDPMLVDPEHGDYRLQPASPAQGYGCQTFGSGRRSSSREPRDKLQAGAVPSLRAAAAGGPRVKRLDAGGPIETDTVWDADTVRVTDDVLVADGVTLTIPPGVRVEFQGYYALRVAGRLLAIGTPEAPIDFTSAHPELFAIDTTRVGCWHGLRFDRTPATNDSSRLEYCRLRYSKAVGVENRGGAIHECAFSKLRIANCIFDHNVADYGAAWLGEFQAAPTIVGCLFHDNHALVGGSAIASFYSYPKLTGNTIGNNHVLNEEICYGTGAIESFIGKPRVRGNIIVMNTSSYFMGGQIYEGKAYYVTYNDIEEGYPGEGDFDADPMFLDAGEHPYSLRWDSPCIDAGPPDTTGLRLPPRDLAGSSRLCQGRMDVGAYEWSDPAGIETHEPREPGGRRPDAAILACAPSPACGATTIRFRLERAGRVQLTLHDPTGRWLATLLDEVRAPGEHAIACAPAPDAAFGAAATSGVAFVRLRLDGRDAGATRLLRLAR
jgi:hypothetical protein